MNQVYFNEPQLLTQWIAANTSVIVAGRAYRVRPIP